MACCCFSPITILGFLCSIKIITKLGALLYGFARKQRNVKDCGEWAVVTGGTDGIGLAVAKSLAARGMSLYLISRNEERLRAAQNEIKAIPGFKKQVKTLMCDFSKLGEEAFATIKSELAELDVGVLYNCAGISYPSAQALGEISTQLIDDLINVNVRSTFLLSHLVYPKMAERQRGIIVCVGSGASVVPSEPLYAAYAGSKGAVEAFCNSLQAEARPNNVLVQCQTPLLVTTKLSKLKTASAFVASTAQYAEAAVDSIERGLMHFSDSTVSPFLPHMLIVAASALVPKFIWDYLRLRQTSELRRRYLKKMLGTKTE